MDEFEEMRKNNLEFEKLLSEYAENAHIPFELIFADAEDELSDEGHSKIISHIDTCEECRKTYQFIKESMKDIDKLSEEKDSSSIPLNPELIAKMKLVALVNSQRDEIAEKVAQLLLPKDMWVTIKPSIEVYRNWLKAPSDSGTQEAGQLSRAAFSDGSSEGMEDFEIVISVVKFSDYICDLLAERCNSLDEIDQKLPEFVNDGIALFDKIELDKVTGENILVNVKRVFEKL